MGEACKLCCKCLVRSSLPYVSVRCVTGEASMGNTTAKPEGLSDEEAGAVRARYKARLAAALGVDPDAVTDPEEPEAPRTAGGREGKEEGGDGEMPISQANVVLVEVNNEAAARLSTQHGIDVRPHIAVVSHSMAWITGTEFVIRIDHSDMHGLGTIRNVISMWSTMQKDSKFRSHETAQLMGDMFRYQERGDRGAVLIRDPLLDGIGGYEEGDVMVETGPNHDEDYVPRHFLTAFPLFPTEYVAINGVRLRDFMELVFKHHSPFYMHSWDRMPLLSNVRFAAEMEVLRSKTPSQHVADGVTVDVRVRKGGTEVDLLFSGRCMAHLLLPMNSAFDKDTVPLGSVVGVRSEGLHATAYFRCHDENGIEVKPETARFNLDVVKYGDRSGDLVPVSPELERELVLLPPGEVWRKHQYIRMIVMTFLCPREMLATMLDDVRHATQQASSSSSGAVGIILEWPHFFHGTGRPGGKLSQFDLPDRKCRFRFICAPMEYFDDSQYLDDDGNMVPPLSSLGYEEQVMTPKSASRNDEP